MLLMNVNLGIIVTYWYSFNNGIFFFTSFLMVCGIPSFSYCNSKCSSASNLWYRLIFQM